MCRQPWRPFGLRSLERSGQRVERESVRMADVDLDLVLGLAGWSRVRRDTDYVANKHVSSVSVIDRRVTILISLVNRRALKDEGCSM
jgi:hypothetical protein